MDILILSPSIAKVTKINDQEVSKLVKLGTFKRSSYEYQYKKLKKMIWFKKKSPEKWKQACDEAKDNIEDHIFTEKDGEYTIKPGSIDYFRHNGLDINITGNLTHYPSSRLLPWEKVPEFEPYPYQSQSVENLISVKHGAISLPTGAGKSYILLLLSKRLGLKTVVATPSEVIFNEVYREFATRLGTKYVGRFGDGHKETGKLITIAIGKSLTMIKPGSPQEEWAKSLQVMIIDEAHQFAAETLEKVCHGTLSEVPYRFFVSATQVRADETQILLDSILGPIVYSMTIREAIDGGYLCPLRFMVIKTFSPSTEQERDAIACKRTHFLRNKNIAKIAAKIANANWTVKGHSTLILVEELEQISMLANLLTVPFTYVHSGTKKDASVWGLNAVDSTDEIFRFNAGEVKVLIGTRSVSTGTNFFPTHTTINWCGGSSEVTTKQGAMGRSTRKLEISKFVKFHKPKPYSMIVDFDVDGQAILKNQLEDRISYYSEALADGDEIKKISF